MAGVVGFILFICRSITDWGSVTQDVYVCPIEAGVVRLKVYM